MRPAAKHLNRRTRQRLYAATAVLSLAIWLFMAVAEACTPLHAWLHGGTIPKNDNCAVIVIAHGNIAVTAHGIIEMTPSCVHAALAVTLIGIVPGAEFSIFIPANKNLSPGRAPPAILSFQV